MLPKVSHLTSWRRGAEGFQSVSMFSTSLVMLAACCSTAKPKGQGLQLKGKTTDSLSRCLCAQRARIKRRDSCITQDLSYLSLLAIPKREEVIPSRNRQPLLNLLRLTWKMVRTVLEQERLKRVDELRQPPAFTTAPSVWNRPAPKDFTHPVPRRKHILLALWKEL